MDYQRGQILLIVVLVMVTALTVGLSVAARSITNIKSSRQAADSEKAFSAAEAGIEKSLNSKTSSTGTFSNSATFKTTVITIEGNQITLNNGFPVLKDSPAALWLSTYPGYTGQRTGNVTVYWGSSSDRCTAVESNNTMAALEIMVIHGSLAAPQLTRYTVDPCAARRLVNKFQNSGAGATVGGVAYAHSRSFAVASGMIVQIVPLYAPTLIAISGCNAGGGACSPLPVQGTLVQSEGTVSDTKRNIQSYQYYPQLPAELLQYTFFVP